MSAFDQALAYVTETLSKGRSMRDLYGEASLASVRALIHATRGATPASAPLLSGSAGSLSSETVQRREAAEPPVSAPRRSLTAQFRAAQEETMQKPHPAPASISKAPGVHSVTLPATSASPVASPASAPPVDSGAPVAPESLATPKTAPLSKEERLVLLFERLPAQAIPGQGMLNAPLAFVNEAASPDAVAKGLPIAGEPMELLQKIITAMGLKPQEIYLTNLKKSPNPTTEEQALLVEELSLVQPKCIVALGEKVTTFLTRNATAIDDARGAWHDFRGIPLMPTFSLEYLLENQSPEEKRKFWEDLLQVLELLGRKITDKQRGYFLQKGRATPR